MTGACDAGKQRNQKVQGPLVSLVEVNVGQNKPLASNDAIRLRFDRYLLPSTITRQSFVLTEQNGAPIDASIVTFDPVSLTVTLRRDPKNASWVKVNQPYRLHLAHPDDNPQGFGLRAIDGAPINPNGVRDIGFTVSADVLPSERVDPPRIDFCADVFPIFNSKCGAGSPCHGGTEGVAAGLGLTTTDGIKNSLLNGRVAQGSNTGARAQSTPAGRVFGVDMPLVDPEGDAANSWLLYKILLAPIPSGPVGSPPKIWCTPEGQKRDPVASRVPEVRPDDFEFQLLNDYVLGREMPYPPRVALSPSDGDQYYKSAPLTFEERQRVRLWIEQGAPVQTCLRCDAPNGGAADGGAADASGD
jgi:hypothetical protein